MISTILEHFRQQAFISKRLLLAPGGTVNGDGAGRKTGLATHAFSGDAAKRNNALIDKIIDISGPCIKIYPSVMTVFERLHLVFYRAREFTEKPALLEAILAKIGQRTFPSYEITRTNTVFRNREELLKYEAAIKLHFDLSRLIESAMGPGRESVVYVRSDESNEASGLNSPQPRKVVKPIRKPTNGINVNSIDGEPVSRGKDTERERRRLEVIGIYEKVIQEAEGIRGAWSEYVATETEISKKSSNYYLLRFSPGYVYTQILRLELRAFAFLKRFEEESILLHELLDQHVYCLGQRGGWYERLALIKSNYAFQKRLGKKEAHQICMMALRDKHVHAVDATLIQGRLIRLESELKIPFRDRHDFSYLTLRKAQTRILTGERLNTPGTAAPGYASSHSYSYIPSSTGEGLSGSRIIAQQRPLWRNIDGSDCSVEELALSYYKTLGYMGYHSENNILSTLFGLLFWDILFSPQPGVFETSYQTEPLDLRTDAFFMQRQEMIMERLENIAKSKIIEEQRVNLDQNRQGQRGGQGGEEDEPLLNRQQRPKSIHKDTLERGVNNEISFHDTIKQEFSGQDAGHPCTVQQQQTENGREEVLAKKRKECFYLNLMQTHDDLYREKNVYCVGVNWVFTKTELLEIAEVSMQSIYIRTLFRRPIF
ncbi:hypothetical protein BX616_003575 [Lobosporangium transversale]|nr:hypothetical protein BX616_003575 [Lobosporangium transversale]